VEGRKVAACFLLLLLVLPGLASAEELSLWPAERGFVDNSGTLVLGRELAETPLPEWHFSRRSDRRYRPGQAVWACPALAVVNGRPMAFVGGFDSTMHALDLMSKEEAWSKITNGPINSGAAIGEIGGRQVVYWGSTDRSVYSFFALEGSRLWTREIIEPTSSLGDVELSAPVLLGGVLYICCFAYDKAIARSDQKAELIALEAATGRELWRLRVGDGPLSTPVILEIGGRDVAIIAARKGLVQAFDLSTKPPHRMWDYQMPQEVLGYPAVDTTATPPSLFLGSKFGSMISLDAATGKERWKKMTGDWLDNSPAVGSVKGRRAVFGGSNDYCVYAWAADSGELLWRQPIGGEVFSIPTLFTLDGKPSVLVSSLDDHTYVLDADDGRVVTSFFTGELLWDLKTKGENVWGSAAVFQGRANTVAVFGSYNGTIFVIPLTGECSLTAKVRSSAGLWIGLAVAFVLFVFVILPVVLLLPGRKGGVEPE